MNGKFGLTFNHRPRVLIVIPPPPLPVLQALPSSSITTMQWIQATVTSKATVATLTERLKTTRKEYQQVVQTIVEVLASAHPTPPPATLVGIKTPSSSQIGSLSDSHLSKLLAPGSTVHSSSDSTAFSTTVQYTTTTTPSTLEESTILLPPTVVRSFYTIKSKLLELAHNLEKETTLLTTQLLPILQGVAGYSKDFRGWGNPNLTTKNIVLSAISGAMTNTIYKCEYQSDHDATNNVRVIQSDATTGPSPRSTDDVANHAHAILVRLYGDGTDAFFNRQDELHVFSNLASLHYGSHALLCQFENGRCERFFTGSRPLTATELTQEEWSNAAMGKEVAMFHKLQMFELQNSQGGGNAATEAAAATAPPTYEHVVHAFLNTVKHCYAGLFRRSKEVWFVDEKNSNFLNEGKKSNHQSPSPEQRAWLYDTINRTVPKAMQLVEDSLLNQDNPGELLIVPALCF